MYAKLMCFFFIRALSRERGGKGREKGVREEWKIAPFLMEWKAAGISVGGVIFKRFPLSADSANKGFVVRIFCTYYFETFMLRVKLKSVLHDFILEYSVTDIFYCLIFNFNTAKRCYIQLNYQIESGKFSFSKISKELPSGKCILFTPRVFLENIFIKI